MVDWNDVGDESSRSSTLLETINEQHVECSVALMQPSQETQDDTGADEPPSVDSNEAMLNVEPIYISVGVGDVVADAGFISGVDPRPIATDFVLDVDPPSIEPEFMPEYKVMYGDEWVEDSTNDQLVPELSNKGNVLLQQALAEHAPEESDYRDLSHTHMAIANGLRFDDNVPLINHDNVIIWNGIIFKTM
jgi:hypothetical protein